MKLRIKKGDTVKVIAGGSKGIVGRVLEVYPTTMRILVEGVNIRKKATRPSQANPNGGIVEREMPIHYSNVQLVDKNGSPTRIGIERSVKEGKTTIRRIAKTTKEEL
jgi:large subunit ribosomal protein L24